MEDSEAFVICARDGNAEAFSAVVRRFQDMAVGYGYALLGDLGLAEDAAQEAFLEAHLCFSQLREPAAFPGWFRRIVFKQCDRLKRGKRLKVVPLEEVEARSSQPSQTEALELRERNDQVWAAIDALPEKERTVVTLYYSSGYSQTEVGAFLDLPVTTIKKRLFSARRRLREMLLDVLGDTLREHRPSRSETFMAGVMDMLNAARAGDVDRVRELLQQNKRLLTAKDWLGNSALVMTINSGHQAVAELLATAGVQPDVYEAAAIGDTERVRDLLTENARLLDSYSAEGGTPLLFAAHFGHSETADVLISLGANINALARNALQVTPLHAALFGRRLDVAKLLIERGADVTIKRGGSGLPRAGWTALHYAAAYGFVDLIGPLLARGADVAARDESGRTPRDVAIAEGQETIVASLNQRGARI